MATPTAVNPSKRPLERAKGEGACAGAKNQKRECQEFELRRFVQFSGGGIRNGIAEEHDRGAGHRIGEDEDCGHAYQRAWEGDQVERRPPPHYIPCTHRPSSEGLADEGESDKSGVVGVDDERSRADEAEIKDEECRRWGEERDRVEEEADEVFWEASSARRRSGWEPPSSAPRPSSSKIEFKSIFFLNGETG